MKYYERLNSLRAIALFSVLATHFIPSLASFFVIGSFGFDIFFVMSGFLITGILIQTNENSFKTNYKIFVGRRTLRIFPIYYLTLLVLWLLHLDIMRDKLLWFVTYTYNYAWVIYNLPTTPATHFWSLALEEQYYLIWPFIALALKKKKNALLLIIVSIILVGYTQWIFNIFPLLSPFNSVGLLTYMAPIGLGCLAAVLFSENLFPDALFENKILECIIFIVLGISLFIPYKFREVLFGITAFYIIVKCVKYSFYINPINKILANKKLLKIGTLSYGVYIFHLPLAYYCTKFAFNPIWLHLNFNALGKLKVLRWNSWIIKFPLYSYMSIVLASISYKYIEMPILKMKDRFFKY
jgi:peptidoglycan/LPS O-acetylase OafA/YrhL